MKRKLFWMTFFYLFGIYAAMLTDLETVYIFAVVLLCIYAALAVILPFSKKNIYIILCIAFMLFGSFYICHANDRSKSFLLSFKGQTVSVTARISDYPVQSKKYFTVSARAESLILNGKMYDLGENVQMKLYDKECSLAPGEIVSVNCKVLMPATSGTIHEDYSLYLKTNKIYTILSVKSGGCTLLSCEKPTLSERLTILRKGLGETVSRYLPDEEAAVLCAMLLGDRTKIDAELSEKFSLSGLAHILAVSGLHVGFACAVINRVFDFLGLSKKLSYILSIAVLCIYVPLSGMSPSCMRAGIMMVVFIASHLLLRRADSLTSLAFAALVITIINPFYAFSVSFMLSFGATLGILIFSGKLTVFLCSSFGVKRKNKVLFSILSTFSMTCSAQILTVPVVLLYFGKFTLWSFVTNILVIPILIWLFSGSMALLFSALIYFPLAKICSYFTYPLLKAVLFVADFFSKQKSGIITAQINADNTFLYILLVILIYLLLDTKKENAKNEPRTNQKNSGITENKA